MLSKNSRLGRVIILGDLMLGLAAKMMPYQVNWKINKPMTMESISWNAAVNTHCGYPGFLPSSLWTAAHMGARAPAGKELVQAIVRQLR